MKPILSRGQSTWLEARARTRDGRDGRDQRELLAPGPAPAGPSRIVMGSKLLRSLVRTRTLFPPSLDRMHICTLGASGDVIFFTALVSEYLSSKSKPKDLLTWHRKVAEGCTKSGEAFQPCQ